MAGSFDWPALLDHSDTELMLRTTRNQVGWTHRPKVIGKCLKVLHNRRKVHVAVRSGGAMELVRQPLSASQCWPRAFDFSLTGDNGMNGRCAVAISANEKPPGGEPSGLLWEVQMKRFLPIRELWPNLGRYLQATDTL